METKQWMQKLWDWADAYDLPEHRLPRDKRALLKLKILSILNLQFISDEIPLVTPNLQSYQFGFVGARNRLALICDKII